MFHETSTQKYSSMFFVSKSREQKMKLLLNALEINLS